MNQMFMERKMSTKQKHGVIVCLPKAGGLSTHQPAEYWLQTIGPNQHTPAALHNGSSRANSAGCQGEQSLRRWRPRERLSHRPRHDSRCVLSLDFQEAFDKISHQYLFSILRSYGFSNWFIDPTRCIYEDAVNSVQISGNIAERIPIECSVR